MLRIIDISEKIYKFKYEFIWIHAFWSTKAWHIIMVYTKIIDTTFK
jgi:hypothetical protein